MSVWGGKVHCRFVVKEIVSDKTGKFHIERSDKQRNNTQHYILSVK
jgi:hypothetical protein